MEILNELNISDGYNLIMGKLESWVDTTIEMLPNMVIAILVMIVFYVFGKVIRKTVRKVLETVTNNQTIIDLFETIVTVMIIGIGFFIALGILNLDGTVNKLLAGAGIVGLALGFAFQGIASNFISGILLSVQHPFGIGDIVESNGYYGTIQKLDLRNTIVKTPQGKIVFIPNKSVFENPLENYTRGRERRIDLSCGISYGEDLEKVRSVVLEAVTAVENRDQDREVEVFFTGFGDSAINFVVRFWVTFTMNVDFWQSQSDAVMAIKKAFNEHDIMIPFPIRTLDFGIRGGQKLDAMLASGLMEKSAGNGKKGTGESSTGNRGPENRGPDENTAGD